MKIVLATCTPPCLRLPALLTLLLLAVGAPPARAQQAPVRSASACPRQQTVQHERQTLALRTQTLDAEIDRWPVLLPILGLAASAVGFGTIAYVDQRWDRPSLTWGLAAIPAAGVATSLGFITYRTVKRHPFASERRRIAQRRSELAARDLMLARSRCGDDATLARAAHASILRIDGQLAHIKEQSEAVPFTGPLTLTVAGTLMAGGFAFVTLIDWLMTTGLTNDPREPNRPRLIGLGVGALTGVALAASGVAWTVKRGRERREIERAARPLKEQKRGLELLLQPSASAGHAGLALNGRF